MEPRKLTREDLDQVRGIEGFPIGTDEDIIALSDAPYYTACPNPFIGEFIAEHGTPYNEATDDYHREPFAADVSEGKNDPLYNAHGYHTKVPHKAIMRYILHYTKPGDVVFDGFCGTGIIFTEFVATQMYLRNLLLNRGYTVTILNGSMSVEERDIALHEFRTKTNIFISTDAGGEGLNLQFANIIINYDLPWNPMKSEQRCGRADRIGQTRDVHIFNFIVTDTVENRVREVLEEKLSVILQEMGVDKYSDVLDSEVAEIDFTEAYMRSIGKPFKIEENLRPIESEMKQQLQNTRKYKDVIREEKDLTALVGQGSDFDVDTALRTMLAYYESWQGHELKLIDRISIADEEIVRHLQTDILQDRKSRLLSVGIPNFPNEAGYFMLWELSVSNDSEDRRIIPIFINDRFVLRPMAGKRLMDVFLDGTSQLIVSEVPNIDDETYAHLEQMASEFAYDTFMEMKDKRLRRSEEDYNKYLYALQLRTEAAEHIGIENIKRSKLQRLQQERAAIESARQTGSQITPDFKLVILIRLEA